MKNTEYYLSKGFDKKTAEYFARGRRKIIDVCPNNDFTLTLTFDNKEKRIYNVAPLLKSGTVFDTFSDLNNFKRVYVDDTNCIAWDINPEIDSREVWNNKVDISSDICYLDSVPVV